MAYIKISQAAQMAHTEINYLHKLIKKGELDARSEQKGKLQFWFVNENCLRFQRLLTRLEAYVSEESSNLEGTELKGSTSHPLRPTPSRITSHPIDWEVWEAMCKRGEEIVHRRCSDRTLANYRDYINRFFRKYPKLNRDTLRTALMSYEQKETPERDYYSAKSHMYFALMTIAKYFVYKGFESAEFVKSLEHLRPQQRHTVVTRRCFTEDTIQSAVSQVQCARTKKNSPAYSQFNAALNTALIHTAFYTGARSSEICGIRLQDVDFNAGSVRLFGKGGKERFVGICPELRKSVQDYLKVRPKVSSDTLFLVEAGTVLNFRYVYRRIKRAGKWAGVKLAPHAIRRTSITWMLNTKKLPMALVRDAVGHSSLAVTNIYTKPTANDVIEAMKQL